MLVTGKTDSKESKSNTNADSYLPLRNTILVSPPGGQSVMDINAEKWSVCYRHAAVLCGQLV